MNHYSLSDNHRQKDVVNDLLLELARQSQTQTGRGLGQTIQGHSGLNYGQDAYDLLSPRGLQSLINPQEEQAASHLLAEQLKQNIANSVQRSQGLDALAESANQQQLDALLRNLAGNNSSLNSSQYLNHLGHLGNLGQVDSLASELLHQNQSSLLHQQLQQHQQQLLGLGSRDSTRGDLGFSDLGPSVGKGTSDDLGGVKNGQKNKVKKSTKRDPEVTLSGRKRTLDDLEEQYLGRTKRSRERGVSSYEEQLAQQEQLLQQEDLEAQLAEQVGRAGLKGTHQEKNREAQRRFREKQKIKY